MQRGAENLMFSARYRSKTFSPENRHSFFGTAVSSLGESVQRARLARWRPSDRPSRSSASPRIASRSRYAETGKNALCRSGRGKTAASLASWGTARGESRNDVAIVTTFCGRASGGGLRDHSYRPSPGPAGRLPDELHALLRNIAARTKARAVSQQGRHHPVKPEPDAAPLSTPRSRLQSVARLSAALARRYRLCCRQIRIRIHCV